jgi:hypothetical protein
MSLKPAKIGLVLVSTGVALCLWLSHGGFGVDVPELTSVRPAPKNTAPPTRQHESEPTHSTMTSSENLARLRQAFVNDPSLAVRCKLPVVETPQERCGSSAFVTSATEPQLVGSKIYGETTKGMTLHSMDSLIPPSRPTFLHSAANGTVVHHPIFAKYATRTYSDHFLPGRVIEFNGAHADQSYDCTGNIDFRQYHQVRAAMCEAYEEEERRRNATVAGFFPLVDEEYFEYVMTLTTAYDAAQNRRPYTFIELGARYGTWIVRAAASYRLFGGDSADTKLLAVEGSCEWYRKMAEHVKCNHFNADLILAYAAPKSYNKVDLNNPTTFAQPRAVSLLEILSAYEEVDMIDFDIQGFEIFAVEEHGAMELMKAKVAFVHFGTHGLEIESKLLKMFQDREWIVLYYFAGAHTKKLNRGHACLTPFGPSLFNDGALGFANPKFYPRLSRASRVKMEHRRPKKSGETCYWHPDAIKTVLR